MSGQHACLGWVLKLAGNAAMSSVTWTAPELTEKETVRKPQKPKTKSSFVFYNMNNIYSNMGVILFCKVLPEKKHTLSDQI